MTPALAGMLVLFGGHDLTGWVAIAGDWTVEQGAIACRSGPAAIRTSFESDHYILDFKYRSAPTAGGRICLNASLDGGGQCLLLTPGGIVMRESTATTRPTPEDGWITASISVGRGHLRAVCRDTAGALLSEASLDAPAGARGFIRFESREPGLWIRDVAAREPEFKVLFDGGGLDGWEVVNPRPGREKNWYVKNGILHCDGQGYGNWLRTVRSYDDFILRLEYRLPPKGNSGIYVRAPLQGRISQIGLEFQLIDNAGWSGRLKASQRTGSVYAGIAPEVEVATPAEQWNAIEVLCDGQHVRTTLNGVRLYDARLDDPAKDQQLLKHPLATRRLEGFIGLQDHSESPMFRNIRIRELPRSTTRPN